MGRFRYLALAVSLVLTSVVAGCASLIPSRPVAQETQLPVYVAPARSDTATPVPTPGSSRPTQIMDCTNELTYLSDLTVPDGTHFNPGTSIEKKWLVQNTGSCNWTDGYTLKFVGGNALSAAETQKLVPTLNGAEAEIKITFTAPQETGEYDSSWQAFDPQGNAFGDKFFLKIIVISP